MVPQRGGGCIFESCDISPNKPTSQAVSLAPFMYACRDSAMPLCHGLAYAIPANGVCLHLLVPPLTQFFSGPTFQRKAKLHSRKGVAYFRD